MWSVEPLAAPSTAGDESAEAEALAHARELFAAGKAEMDRGRWSQAAEHFRQAARVKDTPGLRYHVAFCEENAGNFVEALAQYEAARELLRVRPAPDVADLLGPALERVDGKIPRLSLSFEPAVHPNLVLVDGRAVEGWNELRLDPGVHELRVEAAGYLPYVAEVRLESGERRSLPVVLVEPRDEASRPAEPPSAHGGWRTPAIITGAAVSAAGLGLGIWALLDRSAASREIDHARGDITRTSDAPSACVGASGALVAPCTDLERALDRRDRATAFAVGGFVALGVGASVTVASLFFWPERAVEVNAVTGAGFSGLRVGGRF
jgi:tetratricopeptide (TPR) repeat protein